MTLFLLFIAIIWLNLYICIQLHKATSFQQTGTNNAEKNVKKDDDLLYVHSLFYYFFWSRVIKQDLQKNIFKSLPCPVCPKTFVVIKNLAK